jgi:outer membrane protein assembly factor BamE (lipoprotein component of BamABCDE complex)
MRGKDMGSSRGRRLAGLAAVSLLALSLGGCLGYDGEVTRGYVVDQRALDQVKPGSSAEQVLVVMGTPSTTSTVGGTAWYYISQTVDRTFAFSAPAVVDQRVLAIYFSKDKKVERVANYGLQDGKVFDFVSRTTPTGGAEQGFVKNLFRSLMRFS